ncbi:protein kinase domain protein [Ichthyophthirius multifiliis]|uniref:Protein kinase domain protein n=1 Tax=Ichthyophthirius multifiliis TaxID=5932 RepID=G0QR00_ICHMU|nr:protein kinase domain protein [Ichthyophthirius multifiliis]EGR32355.1 protein kinase domain protein [Ichthyophthirius multifiliis]|eukprot:XP_004035841.1 protein kinase domain protein [Ichthyophthirius multifiliis]
MEEEQQNEQQANQEDNNLQLVNQIEQIKDQIHQQVNKSELNEDESDQYENDNCNKKKSIENDNCNKKKSIENDDINSDSNLEQINQNIPKSIENAQFNRKIQDFILGKKIGSGRFAEVYLATDKITGFKIALKIIKKEVIQEFNLLQDICNELKCQMVIRHPNLINLYGFFVENQNFYLIQEIAAGIELFSELMKQPQKRYPEMKVAIYIRQIIHSLMYLHEQNIIHRDIKPENIMVCDGVLKLCDFGYATGIIKKQRRKTFCGTLDYLSPEMVLKQPYDYSVDIWSVGILTFELIFGKAPFTQSDDQDEVFESILKVLFFQKILNCHFIYILVRFNFLWTYFI